ncbi:MAG: DNA repair protein RecN, partial [Mogibacterium sp.]|nr:DNA repair protein RecN [Mogibacterium sp.]
NGEIVSLGQLRALCRTFVDIHGQYDNQVILDPQNHLAVTDRFHREASEPVLRDVREAYSVWQEAHRNYEELCRNEADALSRQDFYRFEYDHISSLHLREGEDEELREAISYMKNSERIYRAVNSAYALLHEEEPSVLTSLRRCSGEIGSIAALSRDLSDMAAVLEDSYYTLEDLSDSLRHLRDTLSFSEEDIDQASERLSVIEDARRKYRRDISGILAYQQELEQKLSRIENFDADKEHLHAVMEQAYAVLEERAAAMTEIRRQNAAGLAAAMRKELHDLEFANSEFEVRMDSLSEIGPDGRDSLEFMISTNPGEPLRPLAKIASGGEISRIMLAFKHIIGDDDKVETMIFDEIDTGISGRTALVVGRKMREIAGHHQVLCITHLPQIAAFGNRNFLISKDLRDGRTYTSVEPLDENGKVRMLAGMISGDPDSESALQAARELVSAAGH